MTTWQALIAGLGYRRSIEVSCSEALSPERGATPDQIGLAHDRQRARVVDSELVPTMRSTIASFSPHRRPP
jgi:hypothetical protein